MNRLKRIGNLSWSKPGSGNEHTESVNHDSFPTRIFRQSGPEIADQEYLLGLRGFLTIESFVWVFLQTFVPAAVKDANNHDGPLYQVVLRKTLSVLFWNETLIYSAFILLSARTICIPFMKSSTKTNIASSVFRRGLRLWFPTAVALAIINVVSHTAGFHYVDHFKTVTGNDSFSTPYLLPSTLAYFNSVFNLFWTTQAFAQQAGSSAFPSQTLWIVNVIYMQSFTVYMAMVIIPYTRHSWRVKAFLIVIITAWWVQSWAWYTITGLLFADMAMNMGFKQKSQNGIKIYRNLRCPSWLPYILLMLSGLIMEYLWTDWRPEYDTAELEGHTGLYYTGALNTGFDLHQPQARDDNYLLIVGFFLYLEHSDLWQMIFSNRMFCFLGTRSLSESALVFLQFFQTSTHTSTSHKLSIPLLSPRTHH
ncbi:hypothetical protein MMC06_003297 [Schaereria dolodes]|nr:hypothetical protein [Schaereria dolodes]